MNSLKGIIGLDIIQQRQIQELTFIIGKKSNCIESCMASAQLDIMLRTMNLLKWRGFNRFHNRKRNEKNSQLLSNQDLSKVFGCTKRSYIMKKNIGKKLSPYVIQVIRKIPELNRIEVLKKLCKLPDLEQINIIKEIENNMPDIKKIMGKYGLIHGKSNGSEGKPMDAPSGKKAVFLDADILKHAEKNRTQGMLPLENDIEHYLFMKNMTVKKTNNDDTLLSIDNYM